MRTPTTHLSLLRLEAVCMSLAHGDSAAEAELRPAALAAGQALLGMGRQRSLDTFEIVVAGQTTVRGVGQPWRFPTSRRAAEFLIGLVWKDDPNAQRLAFALGQEIDRRRTWTVTADQLRAWALTVEAL